MPATVSGRYALYNAPDCNSSATEDRISAIELVFDPHRRYLCCLTLRMYQLRLQLTLLAAAFRLQGSRSCSVCAMSVIDTGPAAPLPMAQSSSITRLGLRCAPHDFSAPVDF